MDGRFGEFSTAITYLGRALSCRGHNVGVPIMHWHSRDPVRPVTDGRPFGETDRSESTNGEAATGSFHGRFGRRSLASSPPYPTTAIPSKPL
jgi:hypothetical protein